MPIKAIPLKVSGRWGAGKITFFQKGVFPAKPFGNSPFFLRLPENGSAFHTGIAAPDAPDLFFVRGLGIVGEEGGCQRAGGPAELDPLFRLPFAQNGIQETADKTVAAADTVKHGDGAGLDHLPFAVDIGDGTPEVFIGMNDLTERSGKSGGIRISRFHAGDHFLEAVDFVSNAFAAGFGALDLQAELEVFFVTDEDVGKAGDFGKGGRKFGFTVFPERCAVIQTANYAG